VSRAVAPRSPPPAALQGYGANRKTQNIDHFQQRRFFYLIVLYKKTELIMESD
jgi:hypothetical protein